MFRAERPRAATPPPRTVPRWHRDRDEPDRFVATGVLSAVGALVALWPFTSVITPGAWSFTVMLVVVAVVGTGMLVRHLLRRRHAGLGDLGALLAQLVVAVGTLTLLLAGDTAVLGVVPTATTIAVFERLGAAAWEQIVFGSAPLDASAGLAAALGAGFAIVAILLDHLVAQRSAVLATVLIGVIGAVPMIVTFGDPNVVWFVALAITALLLFRVTAQRDASSPRRSSISIATGVGAAAVAATLILAPALPVAPTMAGTGVGVTVDASLRLGDDLRQPNPVEVLTLATDADTAPYLRLTTLSRFDGRVWQPDRGDLQSQADGFGEPEWGEGIATEDATTSIRILRMSSSWLPVPYPATDVSGLNASWRVAPENRTLFSRRSDAAGNDYTVSSTRVTPTLEQIRAVDAASRLRDPDAEDVELPEIISELASEVTADEDTDYDRLVTLQNWFRAQFSYSLETPVEEGFDGTGADAVARFLEERSGYCVHFAGAFALMAESLDMRVRIVVGYLPGSLTDEKRGDESIFSVTSDQLHSWPEVLFPGIGWVAFEPTASLGVPTAFRAGVAQGGTTGGVTEPVPTTAPQTQETQGPEVDRGDTGAESSGAGELRRLDPTPVTLITAAIVVVLLLPWLVRLTERRLRLRRAARGDAAAAWAELRDTLLDLALPVSDADSPRARAAGLVRDRGADAAALQHLTSAVERANYARPGIAETEDLAEPLRAVLSSLQRSVDGPARVRARLLPRSLYAPRGADAALLT
ncbi:transglutaminaseTgpA domain-containing protein [Microbacterium paraoxydans]|uniref:transglutaminase family protein n=1 Tax=Microbacterium paraoxydans TaxID=199592 RepID=UPI003D75E353